MTENSIFPEGFEEPPFGIVVLWGYRKVGKTIGAINTPWGPCHVIDVEFSSEDYEKQMPKMIEMGIIQNTFTRTSCLTYSDTKKEFERIIEGKKMYGTIVIDTVGQITEWKKQEKFKNVPEWKSRIIWGEVRDDLRTVLFMLKKKCKLLILTAHEREYDKVYSPRANPAILEIASVSVRLIKQPNQKVPDGIIEVARLPMFPPRIPEFSIAKLLDYMEKPADWDNLSEEEIVEEREYTSLPSEEE